MDYASDKKMKIFLKGAGIGITGSVVSMLSKELIGKQLGYSPMTIVSTLKVGFVSGLSTLGFLAAYDGIEGWKRT